MSCVGPAQAGCEGKLGVSRTVTLPAALPGTPLKGRDLGLADREVILTYDDGPNSSTTPGVLAALEAECVKATFFMLGKNVRQNREMAKRVFAAGHSVGSHTFSHKRMAELDGDGAKGEMERGVNALHDALPGSFRSSLFRFPYLSKDPAALQIARDMGLVAIDIDVSGNDYTGNACDVSFAKIMSQLEKKRSGIVLMHDVMTNTPCETRTLLASLKLNNYRVVHLVP